MKTAHRPSWIGHAPLTTHQRRGMFKPTMLVVAVIAVPVAVLAMIDTIELLQIDSGGRAAAYGGVLFMNAVLLAVLGSLTYFGNRSPHGIVLWCLIVGNLLFFLSFPAR